MDQGVVGVMGELWCVPEVLNMPQCLRNGARLESCKPCQGVATETFVGGAEMLGEF